MKTVEFLYLFLSKGSNSSPGYVLQRVCCRLSGSHSDPLGWEQIYSSSLSQLCPKSCKGFCLAQLNTHRVLLSSGVCLQHSLGCLAVMEENSIPLISLKGQHNLCCLYMRATSHLFLVLPSGHTHQLHLSDTSTCPSTEKRATMSSATSTIKLCF